MEAWEWSKREREQMRITRSQIFNKWWVKSKEKLLVYFESFKIFKKYKISRLRTKGKNWSPYQKKLGVPVGFSSGAATWTDLRSSPCNYVLKCFRLTENKQRFSYKSYWLTNISWKRMTQWLEAFHSQCQPMFRKRSQGRALVCYVTFLNHITTYLANFFGIAGQRALDTLGYF